MVRRSSVALTATIMYKLGRPHHAVSFFLPKIFVGVSLLSRPLVMQHCTSCLGGGDHTPSLATLRERAAARQAKKYWAEAQKQQLEALTAPLRGVLASLPSDLLHAPLRCLLAMLPEKRVGKPGADAAEWHGIDCPGNTIIRLESSGDADAHGRSLTPANAGAQRHLGRNDLVTATLYGTYEVVKGNSKTIYRGVDEEIEEMRATMPQVPQVARASASTNGATQPIAHPGTSASNPAAMQRELNEMLGLRAAAVHEPAAVPAPPIELTPSTVDSLVVELKREAEDYRLHNGSSKLRQQLEADPQYATPVEGSMTEARAKAAHAQISQEVLTLLEVIEQHGVCGGASRQNERVILFGALFERYSDISNKVVGVLLRARKYGLVFFRGEMLMQRRDDFSPILQLATADQARHKLLCSEGAEDGAGFKWGSLGQGPLSA